MDSLNFNAQIINTHEEYGVFTLGFSKDDSFETYITIQYQLTALSIEEQKQGITRYYLAIGPESIGGYDLISNIELSDTKLFILLSSKGKTELNINTIEVLFDSNEYNKIVHPAIMKIFGTENFLEVC